MSLKAAIKKIWMYANRLPSALHNFTFQPIDESIAFWDNFPFQPIDESITFWDMTSRYKIGTITGANTDVVIVGSGFAGLSCAYQLSKNANVQVNIIDPCFCSGESEWLGDGCLYAVVVPKPAHSFLDELGIPYDEKDKYVVVKHAALFISTILSKLLAMPNVKLFNTMAVKDLIVEKGRVGGVVANRTLIPIPMEHDIQLDMEPIVMEAKVVVCSYSLNWATAAEKLKSNGMINTVPKMMSPPGMNAVEDVIAGSTREIVPGLIVTGTGTELAEIAGAPRMGLQFRSMIAGLKAAHLALKSLGLRN